jgi:hypothetical protein
MGRQNRELFKGLKILPFKSKYILSLALFIVSKEHFVINSDQYNIHSKSCNNYYVPQANLGERKCISLE